MSDHEPVQETVETLRRERDEALADCTRLRAMLRHFACATCVGEHGSYPESVSCYCACHRGYKERWADLEADIRTALVADPAPGAE